MIFHHVPQIFDLARSEWTFPLNNFRFIQSAHPFLLKCCTLQNETKGNTNKKNSCSLKTPLAHPPYWPVSYLLLHLEMSRKYNFSFTDLPVYFLV